MEFQTFTILVKLQKDTQLKGVRAYMVLAKLQEYGTIVDSTPGLEKLEKGGFDDSFEIVYSTKEPEHGIIDDIESISEIESVSIEPFFQPAEEAKKTADNSATSSSQQELVKEPQVAPVVQEQPKPQKPVAEKVDKVEVEKKYIIFQIGSEEFALPIDFVMSIERSIKVTRVPNMPPYILGVINLRGIVIPVIDLKYKFTSSNTEITDATRIIICRYENLEVGFFVDTAKDVLTVHDKYIEAAPEMEQSEATEYIKALIHLQKRIIILLDVAKLFKASGN